MTRTPVKSSHILSVGHEGNALEVEYVSGVVYRYSGVDEGSWNALIQSDSMGRGVRQAIHQEGVVGTKVEPETVELY
jgi:hypothetical protein